MKICTLRLDPFKVLYCFFFMFLLTVHLSIILVTDQFNAQILFYHHHHVPEGLGMLACSLILKMKLVPPSLPRSSYVSSSVWFIL